MTFDIKKLIAWGKAKVFTLLRTMVNSGTAKNVAAAAVVADVVMKGKLGIVGYITSVAGAIPALKDIGTEGVLIVVAVILLIKK